MNRTFPPFLDNVKNEEKYSTMDKQEGGQEKKKTYGTSNDISIEPGSTDFFTGTGPYPLAVIFVLLSKTFEAFAANGIRSILALYLRDSLNFNEEFSTTVLHTFNFFSQFLPIFGAILADSYLGNTKTIFIFCILYQIGCLGMFLGTLPFSFVSNLLIYTSLLLIATGNGFLRACIAALGGHQFRMPRQRLLLDRYFAHYYFFYYFGILLGKIVPAYVRTEVAITPYCEDGDDCYPAVFGLTAIVFFISWIIFLFGLPLYKREYAAGDNTMIKVCGCISYAIYKKITGTSKGVNWLQGSVGKYSEEFINDVSIFIKVIKLFLPIPIYYALLAQQDSSWTFQATTTNTVIAGIHIQADQFKAIGPILLLLQIPLWHRIVLPWMERKNFHLTSLESVSIGGLCAAFAFVLAGFLQHRIAVDPENPPSILWQFPMFFLIMMGEVLISVPGLKFCYTHAPLSMKSVLTAFWFINNAFGNLIVVIFTQFRLMENKSLEFFFYAFLMFIGTIVFTVLSKNYENQNLAISEEQTIETFIHVDQVPATNLEENFLNSLCDIDSDDEEINSHCYK